jgi:DNA end-binding protein Ku
MARPLWSGSLSFGLVTVPVALIAAVRDRDLHFHQLHAPDNAPIEIRRVCSQEDREVPFEEITRAYEMPDGRLITVSDEELEAVEPRRTRTIEIERFVELAEVDPLLFDHPYFLVPSGEDDGSLRAYRLLAEVMAGTERVALGRLVMRAREHLALVRAREGALSLTTLRFPDEVRPGDDVAGARHRAHQPTAEQLDATVAIIEALTGDWDPDSLHDRYRARLKRVVSRKRDGETVTPPHRGKAPEPAEDLMAALEATLADLRAPSQQ